MNTSPAFISFPAVDVGVSPTGKQRAFELPVLCSTAEHRTADAAITVTTEDDTVISFLLTPCAFTVTVLHCEAAGLFGAGCAKAKEGDK